MYRLKNFIAMKVLDSSGKSLGNISDMALNFEVGMVEGFSIEGSTLFHGKRKIAYTKDIIYYGENMVVSKLNDAKPLTFSEIKSREVIDMCGNIIGVVEDFIFDDKFKIKGIIICPGILKKLYEGKRILLTDEVILGEKQVLFHGSNKLSLMTMRHSIDGVYCNE